MFKKFTKSFHFEAQTRKISIFKGLTKEVLKEGNGVKPKVGQVIKAHYTGKLEKNGKVFDSSVARNQPFEFTVGVGQVIRGWDEGFLTMSVGEKAVLTIAPEFGYGNQNVGGGLIPANSTLIFDVELLEIKK
eukprot:gene1633-12758_t